MADLREAMRLITGGDVSQERVQRVMAVAHALDIPKSDAMLPILVALDSYHETLSGTATAAIKAMRRAARHLAIVAVAAFAVIVSVAVSAWVRRDDATGTNPALTRWATSLAGHAAYAFDTANPRAVALLTACDLPTWHRVTVHGRPACEVSTGRDGDVYGWYLPPESKK